MPKSIIGTVGTARGLNNQGDMILHSNTLTTSGFNIETNKEDVRGGQGAGLQGQIFHTT